MHQKLDYLFAQLLGLNKAPVLYLFFRFFLLFVLILFLIFFHKTKKIFLFDFRNAVELLFNA